EYEWWCVVVSLGGGRRSRRSCSGAAGLPGVEARWDVHVQLLPAASAEHDALGACLVAGRKVDRRGHVWIHMESGPGQWRCIRAKLQPEISLVPHLVA